MILTWPPFLPLLLISLLSLPFPQLLIYQHELAKGRDAEEESTQGKAQKKKKTNRKANDKTETTKIQPNLYVKKK